MKRNLGICMVLSGCLLAGAQGLEAQSPASAGQGAGPQENKKQPAPPRKQEANPFPEDTSTVPVMPNSTTPVLPEGTYSGGGAEAALPAESVDPVKSPDDPNPAAEGAIDERESSSHAPDLDKVLNPPDDEPRGKKGRNAAPAEHVETAAEDIEVGKYELDRKNWKAALSRFQSAMVLSPDDPEVYWGLAECARNTGHLADARSYYQKVADYDPDSKHGKEARKLLKDPEIANAKADPAPPASAPGK